MIHYMLNTRDITKIRIDYLLTFRTLVETENFSETAKSILPLTEQHNKARLNLKDKDVVNSLRELIVSVCDDNNINE